MKYGKNLIWFLGELANAEAEQYETGTIEIIGENEQGQEGSTEFEVSELVRAAISRIENLEKAVSETIGFIESTNALKEQDGSESLRLLREVMSFHAGISIEDLNLSESIDVQGVSHTASFGGYSFKFDKAGDNESWYIQVNPEGQGFLYDGWWCDSEDKTLREAVAEAVDGAQLV